MVFLTAILTWFSAGYAIAFGVNPEFYAFLRTLESYPKTISDSSTLILGTDSEYFRYLRDVSIKKEIAD